MRYLIITFIIAGLMLVGFANTFEGLLNKENSVGIITLFSMPLLIGTLLISNGKYEKYSKFFLLSFIILLIGFFIITSNGGIITDTFGNLFVISGGLIFITHLIALVYSLFKELNSPDLINFSETNKKLSVEHNSKGFNKSGELKIFFLLGIMVIVLFFLYYQTYKWQYPPYNTTHYEIQFWGEKEDLTLQWLNHEITYFSGDRQRSFVWLRLLNKNSNGASFNLAYKEDSDNESSIKYWLYKAGGLNDTLIEYIEGNNSIQVFLPEWGIYNIFFEEESMNSPPPKGKVFLHVAQSNKIDVEGEWSMGLVLDESYYVCDTPCSTVNQFSPSQSEPRVSGLREKKLGYPELRKEMLSTIKDPRMGQYYGIEINVFYKKWLIWRGIFFGLAIGLISGLVLELMRIWGRKLNNDG